MTDEAFRIGIKIVTILTIILLICEVIVAVSVFRKKKISTSILDEIQKDVSDSELLKEQDLNKIDIGNYYVEE